MNKIVKLLIVTGIAISALFLIINREKEPEIKKKSKLISQVEYRQKALEKKIKRKAAGKFKHDNPSKFAEIMFQLRTREGDEAPTYKQNQTYEELAKARQRGFTHRAATPKLDWVERGPGNVSGRTRTLVIDPDSEDASIWYVGAVGGGIWKTENSGESWTNLTPELPNLSISTLVMSPANTNVLYAGTGESFASINSVKGNGIFKSVDKGVTWTQLESTANDTEFNYINRLIIDPNNENIVIAATLRGIYKTIDGGVTWNETFDDFKSIQHIIYDPNDFNIQYASAQFGGVLKSTDAGNSWEYKFRTTVGRIELAISEHDRKTIFALDENSKLYITYDSGENWKSSEITSGDTEAKYLGTQGYYDNAIYVAPNTNSTVYIGGLDFYKVDVTGDLEKQDTVDNIEYENISNYMSLVNFGANMSGGRVEVMLNNSNYADHEIRFGSGLKQKAHRFTVPSGSTSGVPASSYSYQDYVEVPFQVWDTKNNKQLMVSFRDQGRDGEFNLIPQNEAKTSREYVYVHADTYSENASESIAQTGGHVNNYISFFWPVLKDGATWDKNNIPESKIKIKVKYIGKKSLRATKLTNWYPTNNYPYVHADFHFVQTTEKVGNPYRIIVANDGGVSYSDNGGSAWTHTLNGYNSTQFYGVDKHPTEDRYVGGLQDNGSWISPKSPDASVAWKEAYGGDGFDAVWHAKDPSKTIVSLYYNQIFMSNDNWEHLAALTKNKITDVGEGKGPFFTRVAYSPQNPDRLYLVGASGVTRSENFGNSWSLSPINSKWGFGSTAHIAISENNTQVVWAGCRMGSTGKVFVSTDGGVTFNATSDYKLPLGRISGIATHPHKPNTAFVLFSFNNAPKILRTDDLGETWYDISGFENETEQSTRNFPNVAVHSLMVMPYDENEIWAGTEIGLFISKDNGESWSYSNNGLPAVCIWEMKVRGNQVIMATHGRGIWSANIDKLANSPKPITISSTGISPSNTGVIKYNLETMYDSIHLNVEGQKLRKINGNNSVKENEVTEFDLTDMSGEVAVKMIGYKNGNSYTSSEQKITIINYHDAVDEYSNDFSVTPVDHFYTNGFTVREAGGIVGKALHSPHPYSVLTDYTCYLKYPVVIKADDNNKSLLRYRDIPVVEEGEADAAQFSSDFYDYVVVEATSNGVDWIPVTEGYDFSKIKQKAANLDISIESTLMNNQLYSWNSVDLLQHFSEGDKVVIRFRLHSDPGATGWGWVIDDLSIQSDELTSVDDKITASTKVYPNPANDHVFIETSNEYSKEFTANVYNVAGQLLLKKQFESYGEPVKIDLPDLNEGIYLLKISGGSKTETIKIKIK